MEERKIPSYFEVVDLVDKTLPPKDEFDYTKADVDLLIYRFNMTIEKSGFYFKEEELVRARKIIRDLQKFNYQRSSNFVGGKNAPHFDQNNYYIQNALSQMKNGLIRVLSKPDKFIAYDGTFDTRELGSVESLRERMTRDKVESYIKSVLTTTWEEQDTLRIEERAVSQDILYHFGIITGQYYTKPKHIEVLARMIDNMVQTSRDFYGQRDSEGFYDRSETNRGRHPLVLEETINKMTEYIYMILRDTLDKTEEKEALRRPRIEKAIQEVVPKEQPEIIMDRNAPKHEDLVGYPEKHEELIKFPEHYMGEDELEIPTEGSIVEELEAAKKRYEAALALIDENLELAKQLGELRAKEEEIVSKIKANTAEIQKKLKK